MYWTLDKRCSARLSRERNGRIVETSMRTLETPRRPISLAHRTSFCVDDRICLRCYVDVQMVDGKPNYDPLDYRPLSKNACFSQAFAMEYFKFADLYISMSESQVHALVH